MKFNNLSLRLLSLLLSILIVCVPVLATNLETGNITHFGLPGVFDYDPYNIQFITSVDQYIVVDQVEFLNSVVQGFMANLAWEQYVNFTPYSVQHCEINYKYYRCITAPRFDFTLDTSLGSYVSINGFSYSTGTSYTFPNSTSDLYFDRAITLRGSQTTSSGHSQKTAYAYGIYKNPIIRLMVCDDSDNSINTITDYLDSIRINVYAIATSQNSAITFLSNLYTAVSNISSDVTTIKNYLSSISTNVSAISSTCSSILTQSEVNGQLLEDINDFITYHFPIIEDDLYYINSSINTFRSDFNTFALNCLSSLNSIDTTTQSIDDNLDELLQLQKGTALQNVNVSTSGGSTFSLWNIIKNSVTLGLSATGGFFSGLFDLLGIFGQYSSGFDSFRTLSTISPVTYVPEDLVIANNNLFPGESIVVSDGSNGYSVVFNGTIVNYTVNNPSDSFLRYDTVSFTLEPGNYVLYGVHGSSNKHALLLRKNGNTTFGSYVYSDNYPFTLTATTVFKIRVFIYRTAGNRSDSFEIKVVKTS